MTCWPEAGVTNNGLFKINIAKIVVVAISHQPGNIELIFNTYHKSTRTCVPYRIQLNTKKPDHVC